MIKKAFVKVALQIVLFIIAGGVTLLAVQKWNGRSKPSGQSQRTLQTKPSDSQPETLAGVRGLTPNEVVALPELPGLAGGPVALSDLKEEHLLVCFVSTSCGGCARDAAYWRGLQEEAAKRKVAFYLISVAGNQADTEQFVEAHALEGLPVLYDPDQRAARSFKVGFAPQYVLLTARGKVVARWDGLRRYEGQTEKLTQMFEHISD